MGTFNAIQGPLETRSTVKLESYSLGLLHPLSSRANLTSHALPHSLWPQILVGLS